MMPVRNGWLIGPIPDLFCGCGLGYAALLALLLFFPPSMSRVQPFLPLLVLLIGIPHYGATLLRVYAQRDARKRYALFAFPLSALVALAFLIGLRSPPAGSWLITLYLTWSPWHYTAQNYGLTLLFLRRRGIPFDERARRWLRAWFTASYALVFFSYHRNGAGGGSDPLYAASAGYRFQPLGVPEALIRIAVPILLGLCLLALVLALRPVLGRARSGPGRLRPFLPAAALLLSQTAWFSLPAVWVLVRPASWPGNRPALLFIWVALAHCLQYLWISLYHRRASQHAGQGRPDQATGGLGYLGKAMLIGAALWTVPAVVFAPGGLSGLCFDGGLALLIAAAVNLHHFVLDGAIWKLRDPRVGQVLLSPEAAVRAVSSDRHRPGPPSLGAVALWTLGGLSILFWVGNTWEQEIGYRRAYAAGDLLRLQRAALRLSAIGRDGPQIHVALGKLKARAGHAEEALDEYRRSLALLPTARAFIGIGRIHKARGQWRAAREAYQAALSLSPDDTVAREELQALPGSWSLKESSSGP